MSRWGRGICTCTQRGCRGGEECPGNRTPHTDRPDPIKPPPTLHFECLVCNSTQEIGGPCRECGEPTEIY